MFVPRSEAPLTAVLIFSSHSEMEKLLNSISQTYLILLMFYEIRSRQRGALSRTRWVNIGLHVTGPVLLREELFRVQSFVCARQW